MAEIVDLTGRKIGKINVVKKGNGRRTKGGQYKTTWICKCECGNVIEVDAQKLKKETINSCGCFRYEKISQSLKKNIEGERFNRLEVVRYLKRNERKTKGYNWLCKCDCGNYIHANASKLKTGHTKSCGCLEKELIGSINKKYKHRDIQLYRIFRAMIGRCYNPKNKRYKDYGGRGLTVCDEWLNPNNGFDVFYEWAYKNGYKEGLTIDRINNYEGYSPNNCRWITNLKQQNNRRNNIFWSAERKN